MRKRLRAVTVEDTNLIKVALESTNPNEAAAIVNAASSLQYVVDYRSTKPAALGGYRTVRVEAVAPGHGKLIVRTKKGYFAQTPLKPTQVSQSVKQ